MRCVSGVYINVFNPNPEHLLIEDIAHGLSMIPRFGGQLPYWYSVANHSLNCAKKVIEDGDISGIIFDALMHDSSEAYLNDFISPIKKSMSQYLEVEDNFMKILAKKFNFTYPLTEYVKEVDKKMLEFEWKIMIVEYVPFEIKIKPSKDGFLRAFNKYKRIPINMNPGLPF